MVLYDRDDDGDGDTNDNDSGFDLARVWKVKWNLPNSRHLEARLSERNNPSVERSLEFDREHRHYLHSFIQSALSASKHLDWNTWFWLWAAEGARHAACGHDWLPILVTAWILWLSWLVKEEAQKVRTFQLVDSNTINLSRWIALIVFASYLCTLIFGSRTNETYENWPSQSDWTPHLEKRKQNPAIAVLWSYQV